MQFRLKSLFWFVFFVAAVCGVLFALPNWVSCIVLAAVAFVSPAAIVSGIVYGRGARRAFAIGCLASGGWTLFGMPYVAVQLQSGYDEIMSVNSETAMIAKIVFVAYYAVLLLSGLASVGIRRLCYQGRNGIRPPRDCC
jgi:hypothetical protein